MAQSEFQAMLIARDGKKSSDIFAVLCELQQRDEGIRVYIDLVSTRLISHKTSTAETDKQKFTEEHTSLNYSIMEVFNFEVSSRIVEVFGGDLWYRITVEMVTKYFKTQYKQFIQEALDTEGKSKLLFLEILEDCITNTRFFIAQLKKQVLQPNDIELDAEIEAILSFLFNDY